MNTGHLKDQAGPFSGRAIIGDFTMAYTEWRPDLRGAGPTLLFVHATGFHGRLWDEIVGLLPGHHIICVDQRGHGNSSGGPVTHWGIYGEDLAKFVTALDLHTVCGIGHSMGSCALIVAAARLPGRFANLLLLDPVVFAPALYVEDNERQRSRELQLTTRRKRHFSSPGEMFDRFEGRLPYSLFSKQAMRSYCQYGVHPQQGITDPKAAYTLACAPEVESSIYLTSMAFQEMPQCVAAVVCPVLVVRAKKNEDPGKVDFTLSPTWPGLAGAMAQGRDLSWPHLSHFIPMQAPADVAALVRAELAATLPS